MSSQRVPIPITVLSLLVLAAFLLVGTTNVPPAAAENHDIYNPARTALINAQRQLAEASRQEQDILERFKRMHAELDSSLKLLASAGQLDPSMKARIEDVRSQLSALQDKPALCPMDSNSSLGVYGQLLDDLQTLIEHY